MSTHLERVRRGINLALCAGCLLAGGAGMWWLVRTRPEPPQRTAFNRLPEVAVEPVRPVVEATPVVGYGTVRPKHQVNIVPQVSGKLIHVHGELATGKIIPEGDLLFEIDPTVYEARKRQAEAEVRGLEAALSRTEQEMTSLDQRIENAEQILAIEKADYETSRRLYEQENVGTQRDVDMVYQKYLRQRDALIELKNRRDVLPYVKLETEAKLDAARARLRQAEKDLENTKIFCPFDARVEVVSAYKSQVVTAHFSVATLTDMSAFELSVGIDPRDLRWLHEAIRPENLESTDLEDRPWVTVRWSMRGSRSTSEFTWRGRVTRFERVDEATRTARLVVEVRDVDMVAQGHTDGPDAGATADRGPMLTIGMHCRADLPAQRIADALLVPRHAIYDNEWVYVFVSESQGGDPSHGAIGRMERRRVPLLRSLGGQVLVDYGPAGGTDLCELEPGDLVITSPLSKPVVGKRVRLRDERIASMVPAPPADEAAPWTHLARGHARSPEGWEVVAAFGPVERRSGAR